MEEHKSVTHRLVFRFYIVRHLIFCSSDQFDKHSGNRAIKFLISTNFVPSKCWNNPDTCLNLSAHKKIAQLLKWIQWIPENWVTSSFLQILRKDEMCNLHSIFKYFHSTASQFWWVHFDFLGFRPKFFFVNFPRKKTQFGRQNYFNNKIVKNDTISEQLQCMYYMLEEFHLKLCTRHVKVGKGKITEYENSETKVLT